MIMLDSFAAFFEWLQTVLTEIVKGIKGTYKYWNEKKDELADLVEEEEE